MSLTHEEFVLEEAKLKYRTTRLRYLILIVSIVGYVLFELIRVIPYIHIPREVERIAQENRPHAYGPSEPVPYVSAEADGPDLRVEAGLQLHISSDTEPDGTGTLQGLVWDFPPGSYRLEEAPRAAEVLPYLQTTMEDFAGKDLDGLEVEMEVIGSADGIAVRDDAVYEGDLGDIRKVSYYSYDRNQTASMTLIGRQTPLSNEAIAFLRAYSLLLHANSSFVLSHSTRYIGVDTENKIGGEYRRVIVRLTVRNALREQYEELGPVVRHLILRPRPNKI